MLRTFRPESIFMTFSLENLKRSLPRSLFWCASAAVLARIQPVAGLAPFAMAIFAAGLAAKVSPLALLLGCLTGMFTPDGLQTAVPLGLAVVLAGSLGLQLLEKWLPRDIEKTSVPLLAGLAVLLPGTPLTAAEAWQWLRWAGCAAAAATAAPFLLEWIRVRPTRRHLLPEEHTGLIVFLCASGAGLCMLWPPLAVTAAMMAALIAAPLGAGAAACTGLGGGTSLLFAGLEPVRAAALGVCGLLAGLAPARKAYLAPILLCAGALTAFLTMGSAWVDPACALAASALTLILPNAWTSRARQWLSGESAGACDPDRLAMRLRSASEKKLRALSDAFGVMSDSYRIPADVPDEQRLIAQMRDRLCENCSHYAQCWVGGDNRSVRFLCQLISEAIDWAAGDCSEPLFGDEMPPEALRQCHRGRSIPARLGVLLEEFARKRRSEMKRGQVNQLISAQFLQAQLLLRGLADAQSGPLKIRGRQAARARAALDRAGIEVEEVMALRGERQMEIIAVLDARDWSRELAARASIQLSRTFGRPYAPAEGAGTAQMRFVRLPRMRANASACCHSSQPGSACGDSHMVRELDGDRLLLLISDGMGSGEAAERESAQTVKLLGRFLAADVPKELALETVNELMLARTDSDMFATVDLCVVDLLTGTAEFSKLAACRSVILRKDEVIRVEGGRLPLGILEGVRASTCRVILQPGDVIIMASDGVMEAVSCEEMEQTLLKMRRQPPTLLAESLIRSIEALVAPDRRDDMTVLCAAVSAA